MGPPSYLRAGDLFLVRLDPCLPSVIAARDFSGDGRLDDHFRDHTCIYVGNGSIVHASNYYKYEVIVTEMGGLDVLCGGKRFRLR